MTTKKRSTRPSGETDTVARISTGQATGNAFSETGHKAATDVNTEESISTYNGLLVQQAVKHAGVLDNLSTQILQNAIESANLVSKQAIRHTDIAIDREWNVDEQSVAVAALYARLIERLNNPTPPDEG